MYFKSKILQKLSFNFLRYSPNLKKLKLNFLFLNKSIEMHIFTEKLNKKYKIF